MARLTLQPCQPRILKPVLGQHSLHGASQNLTTAPFGKHLVHCHALQATGPCVVRVVLLLEPLLAGRPQVVAACDHHVVTAVRRRIVDGLVLAHEDKGNAGGQAAQRTRVGAGINIVPCPGVGKAGLINKC
jgi:hypothetical protein